MSRKQSKNSIFVFVFSNESIFDESQRYKIIVEMMKSWKAIKEIIIKCSHPFGCIFID